MRQLFKIVTPYILLCLMTATVVVYSLNQFIETFSERYVYSDIESLPYNKSGLVLGTSRYMRDGSPNPFFHNRIKAAARLFHSGKVDYLIVSGDNSEIYYNEPLTMKRELLKYAIPPERIFLDYAGFRTLDAVVRCKYIFQQERFTVVSQEFHTKRAVFIARKKGIEAIGFNADNVDFWKRSSVRFREFFARMRVFIDLAFDKQPKFFGDKIEVGSRKTITLPDLHGFIDSTDIRHIKLKK